MARDEGDGEGEADDDHGDSVQSGTDDDDRDSDARGPATGPALSDDWESNQAIYARFAGPLAGFLSNKVASAERDELLQDTFLRFMEKRAKGQLVDRQGRPFDGPGPLLFGIARMLLLELLRKLAKAQGIDDVMEMPLASIDPGVHTLISREEKNTIVHDCLREIPFHQQMVLECHYMQRMSYQELARFLDVPIGTIASWCRRGRKSLRARLEKARQGERGKKLPAGLLDDESAESRRGALAAYAWYDPTTGAIDTMELLEVVTRCERKPVRLPEWFVRLELPPTLPEAPATELYEVARGVWDAWVEAGRPEA